jgi:hypothetical protein
VDTTNAIQGVLMNTGPRYARRVDGNHAEIRDLFKECGIRCYGITDMAVLDTSNLGGKVGDLIVQYTVYPVTVTNKFYESYMETHIIETKADKKKKLTDSQESNVLKLVRIDCRADVFELLGVQDWDKD